jgi:hypothetical protein
VTSIVTSSSSSPSSSSSLSISYILLAGMVGAVLVAGALITQAHSRKGGGSYTSIGRTTRASN